MTDVYRLPPELWRLIIRYATLTEKPVSAVRELSLRDADSTEDLPCTKNDPPLTPIIYHRKSAPLQSAMEAFTQSGMKRSLALVCRMFNQLVGEFLFEKLYISDPRLAYCLASTLENSASYANPGKWARHVTIVGVFFTWPASSEELANAALRILKQTPHLRSFHLSWNSTSREFREREHQIIASVPTGSLRHFEWECTGGGFERQNDHPFFRLLKDASPTLRVLKLSGYLPLAELPVPTPPQFGTRSQGQSELQPQGQLQTNNNDNNNTTNNNTTSTTTQALTPLPKLTHLKVRRAFRDDLLFISQWSISTHLTCLSLGSIWAYFDHRELAFAFWDTPKPALRCLHLGEGSNVSPSLARKILNSAHNLKVLEYFFLGDWDASTWYGVRHRSLEVVKVHVSHPVIALRSLFNSQRYSRDQQWDKILRHVSPFLGCMEEYNTDSDSNPNSNPANSNSNSNSGTATQPMSTNYSAMKKLIFLEYTRKFEDLQYEPAELADWLKTTIEEADIKTDVQMSVEVEDYIR
ncbi:uncharacterized protein FOMMEDRAFT_161801 [Fomitiporia mediterranea MF3/22]|uniref:uncharacterized protein n=1 Tax=Fomitiporia mediterranea (strain MF3/22) TaxID=694068 RepID=UPI00044072B8|nr:uncharacterized protein FOMMEDRAFT_161801 [Fomitiporia mediterranea MF3/22]EJC98425.1 hypothetical protein FOMMEDRAFT_161801 [Fomitiporia mediterranea MF3/22]